MLCPLCHGHRLFYIHGQLAPCPECEGQGEIHCCDGLREQPEEMAKDDSINPSEPDALARDI
jgi:hypothetical protein